jgi:hypothetical protein
MAQRAARAGVLNLCTGAIAQANASRHKPQPCKIANIVAVSTR